MLNALLRIELGDEIRRNGAHGNPLAARWLPYFTHPTHDKKCEVQAWTHHRGLLPRHPKHPLFPIYSDTVVGSLRHKI